MLVDHREGEILMKLRNWEAVVLGGLTVLASQGVFADTSPPTSPTVTGTAVTGPTVSTTTTQQSVWDKIGEKATLSFFGIYRGAPLSDLGNSLQPDTGGNLDPSTPQSVESYLTAGYKFDKDTMLGVGAHFFYYPVGSPVGTGQDIQMYDPSIVLSKSNLINVGGLKVTGRIYAELPLSSADRLQRDHDSIAISPTFIANYDVPHTALTVGAYGYITAYLPGSNLAEHARSYKMYFAPTANYQLSKRVAATLWVDLFQITRNRGTGFVSGMSNYTVDIEPGINWDITDKISINPMINFYPATPTLAATSLQAVIMAKAF